MQIKACIFKREWISAVEFSLIKTALNINIKSKCANDYILMSNFHHH